MIEIVKAPPFATVQDLGRTGLRHQGVPPAGAMDVESLAFANLLVGNVRGAAGVEWALGGGIIRLLETRNYACFGATVITHSSKFPSGTPLVGRKGDEIEIGVPDQRFAYLAIGGGVDVPVVLGSRSTYLPGKFGGHEGRRLRIGDRLPLGPAPYADRGGWHEELAGLWPSDSGGIRIVPGPQADAFQVEARTSLEAGAYGIDSLADRMGYRMEGPALNHGAGASRPSEPVCVGAVQWPDEGKPIVLMPDGPTVGGYPKIAAIITADISRFAQLRTGARPVFRWVSAEDAVAALRDREQRLREAERLGQGT